MGLERKPYDKSKGTGRGAVYLELLFDADDLETSIGVAAAVFDKNPAILFAAPIGSRASSLAYDGLHPWPSSLLGARIEPWMASPTDKTGIPSTSLTEATSTEVESVFLEHLPAIRERAAKQAARSGFSPEDAEDFSSWAQMKILANDYRILRAFRGRSRLATFLSVVIGNLVRDYRNHLWGKYRPSAKAQKLGPLAVALEQLIVRDGLAEAEAIATIQKNASEPVANDDLLALLKQLPQRSYGRSFVGTEQLEKLESPTLSAEESVITNELETTRQRLSKVLSEALEELPAQDLLILKMVFLSGRTIASVARVLDVDQRSLYQRRDHCLKRLRHRLASSGLEWSTIESLLEQSERTAVAPIEWAFKDRDLDQNIGRTPERREGS